MNTYGSDLPHDKKKAELCDMQRTIVAHKTYNRKCMENYLNLENISSTKCFDTIHSF